MKTKLGLLVATLFLFSGCLTENQSVTESTFETVVRVTESSGVPKTLANIGIEGMACERACGGSIKKALLNMDGIITAEIKFDEDEAVDFAVVEFDESKISSEEMVKAVTALHKGQFTVKSVAIEKQVKKLTETSEQNKSGEKIPGSSISKIDYNGIAIPNILDILNNLLR